MIEQKIAASELLLAERLGEARFQVHVLIGLPQKIGEDPEEWATPVGLSPLYNKLHDAHGGSSVQSLCLAIRLIYMLLQDFLDKGGKLFYDSGEAFDLQANFGSSS